MQARYTLKIYESTRVVLLSESIVLFDNDLKQSSLIASLVYLYIVYWN